VLNYAFYLHDEAMALVGELVERYKTLISKKSVFEVETENQKQQILKEILAELNKEAPSPFRQLEQAEHMLRYTQKTRMYAYYILLSFGVLEDVANSYFMGSALFLLLMPTLSSSMLFMASLVYALIEGALFYLFDSYELRTALDVQDPHFSLPILLNQFETQVKLATQLNQHLSMMCTLSMSDESYRTYLYFLNLLSDDLEKKMIQMQRKNDRVSHQIFRCAVMLFGAISSLAGSYFMVTTLMSLVCLPMLTTPLGLAVIVLTMGLGLAFHYFMDTTSLTRVINPEYEKFESVKEALASYHSTYPKQPEALLNYRARYKKTNYTLFRSQAAANHEDVSDESTPKASIRI
jgi:hypothetical protein